MSSIKDGLTAGTNQQLSIQTLVNLTKKIAKEVTIKNGPLRMFLKESASYYDFLLSPPVRCPVPFAAPVYPSQQKARFLESPGSLELEKELDESVNRYSRAFYCWQVAKTLSDDATPYLPLLDCSPPASWPTPVVAPMAPNLTLVSGERTRTLVDFVRELQECLWDTKRWQEAKESQLTEESHQEPGDQSLKRRERASSGSPQFRKRPERKLDESHGGWTDSGTESPSSENERPDSHTMLPEATVYRLEPPKSTLPVGTAWPTFTKAQGMIRVFEQLAEIYDRWSEAPQWNNHAKALFLNDVEGLSPPSASMLQRLSNHKLTRKFKSDGHYIHWYPLEVLYTHFGRAEQVEKKGPWGMKNRLLQTFGWEASINSPGPDMDRLSQLLPRRNPDPLSDTGAVDPVRQLQDDIEEIKRDRKASAQRADRESCELQALKGQVEAVKREREISLQRIRLQARIEALGERISDSLARSGCELAQRRKMKEEKRTLDAELAEMSRVRAGSI